jgi:phage terminase large subunit-like protein
VALSNAAALKAISEDRALGSAMLFPHRHPQASPRFHVDIMDLWRSRDENVLVEAFREGAKSTLSEEFLLLEACFGNFGYCIILGETYTKACQRLEAIKHEAIKNMKIYNLFGKIKVNGNVWNENQIELANGVMIEAHGWEEELRGFKWHDLRPDRAYLDDIENRTSVKDKTAVDATMKKIYLELMPAMDKERGKIRVTGTPLAEDCMISRLRVDPSWTCGHFPICNGDIDDPATEALWPDRYPMEWVRKKRDEYERAGQLRGFMQEYMLLAIDSQDKPFEERHINEVMFDPAPWLPKTLIVDPARTTDIKKSDRTGRVVVSRLGSKVYVHASSGEFWKPDQVIDDCFETSKKYGEATVAIEKNSLDEWLLQPMRAMMLSKGRSLNLKPLQAPQNQDKTQFIMGLQPFFEAGDIVLVGGRHAHKQLVAELMNFPSGRRDIVNALAYVLRVYTGTPVYEDFGPWNFAEEYEPPQGTQLAIAFNASASETTAALVAVEGERMVVLADWASPVAPAEAVPDILTVIRAVYPGRRLSCWVTADIADQKDRLPLMNALRAQNMPAHRGGYASVARGALSPLIRTEARGRRLLLVTPDARHTGNALAGGYNFPLGRDLRISGEPERNPHRTLIEGLETLATSIYNQKSDMLPENAYTARNPQGTEYLTSLPTRRR